MKTIEIKDWDTNETIHFLTGKDIRIKDIVQDAVNKNISLGDADLRGSNLIGADLIQADLTRAYLIGSILVDADFTDSILDGVEVDGHTVINKKAYDTIPDQYKHIFDVCRFSVLIKN